MTMTNGACPGATGTITAYLNPPVATVSFYGCSGGPGSTDSFTITPAQPVGTAFAANGTLTAATATTVTLASGSSTTAGYYTNNLITMLPTSSCAGKTATITNYVGSTLTATVSFSGCTPGSTDSYAITPPLNVSYSGALTASSSSTVTLASTSSMVSNYYTGAIITMATGSGSCPGDSGQITGYASPPVATVSIAGCSGGPGSSDKYTITPSAPASYSGVLGTTSSTTVVLGAGASWANSFYTNAIMTITDGACAGDTGTITNYVGSTLVATVSFSGTGGSCTPSAGNTYTIAPAWWVAPVSTSGTVPTAGGTLTTVALASNASTINNFYTNATMTMSTGACANKSATITNYVGGASQLAYVTFSGCSSPYSGIPSFFEPMGRVNVRVCLPYIDEV
jgi:hypothetical protein